MRKITILALFVFFAINQPILAEQQRNVALLASSCAACHGTNGYSVAGTPSLAGTDKLHFIEQMQQFVNGERVSTVMHHHASGYTQQEIEMMAEFFASQKRLNRTSMDR
jgi:cytochrome c553